MNRISISFSLLSLNVYERINNNRIVALRLFMIGSDLCVVMVFGRLYVFDVHLSV